MLLHVPASLDELLVLLRPVFTQPTFQTFRGLLVGQICQTGQRTVCGMLVGARLSGVWHHARAHRFFSHARWQVDELGLRIAALIVERLCEPDAAIRECPRFCVGMSEQESHVIHEELHQQRRDGGPRWRQAGRARRASAV